MVRKYILSVYRPDIYGTAVRERLRGRLCLLTHDSREIADAAHLGTAFMGNQHLTPQELLQHTRRRFAAASGRFLRNDGDTLTV